ncbi:MAG: conjugal transfer protein TraD [Gammaproteobacteria bacterium]|nr:conjugal transfer protein TraD [Gammaproteobacteria bacterium]
MSDYANKLASITERKQKLLEEESKLIEKRKQEIGQLAEKFGLLTLSDAVMNGLFLDVQSAAQEKSEKIKSWESEGTRFLKPKRDSVNNKAAEEQAT